MTNAAEVATYEELKAHFEKGGTLKINLTGLKGNPWGPTVTKIAEEEPNTPKRDADTVFFYCATFDGVDRAFPVSRRLAGYFIETADAT